MSLSEKILKVIEAVERVPKNGYNAFNKYNYVQEADLLDYIRPIMVQHGIIFGFNVEEIRVEPSGKGVIAYAKCRFTLIDAKNPEDKIESVVWGAGYDTQDKGLYKAYTGATKYFLMKQHLVSTGDDPERDQQEERRKTYKTVPAQQSQPHNKQPVNGKDPLVKNLPQNKRDDLIQKLNKRFGEIATKEKPLETLKKETLINGYGVDKIEELTLNQARKIWDDLVEAV